LPLYFRFFLHFFAESAWCLRCFLHFGAVGGGAGAAMGVEVAGGQGTSVAPPRLSRGVRELSAKSAALELVSSASSSAVAQLAPILRSRVSSNAVSGAGAPALGIANSVPVKAP